MFDTIGRDADASSGKRRAQSVLIAVGLLGAGFGFVAGLAGYVVADAAIDPGDDEPMFEVAIAVDDAPTELPPAPPAPLAAAKGDDTAAEPEPDTAPEVVRPLEPTPERPMVSAQPTAGRPDGDDHGEPDGDPGGVPGGSRFGAPGGEGPGGAAPRVVHHSELRAKRRVDPVYPDEARALRLGDQRCVARVRIDADGVPSRVRVDGCPDVFHGPTERALLRWRWAAPRDERGPVPAETTLVIVYRLQ